MYWRGVYTNKVIDPLNKLTSCPYWLSSTIFVAWSVAIHQEHWHWNCVFSSALEMQPKQNRLLHSIDTYALSSVLLHIWNLRKFVRLVNSANAKCTLSSSLTLFLMIAHPSFNWTAQVLNNLVKSDIFPQGPCRLDVSPAARTFSVALFNADLAKSMLTIRNSMCIFYYSHANWALDVHLKFQNFTVKLIWHRLLWKTMNLSGMVPTSIQLGCLLWHHACDDVLMARRICYR